VQILPSGQQPASGLALAPFRGLRYAQERVSGIAEVTSPPYDVIAAKLGDVSPLQAANLLVTAKRMFERELRAVIAEYSRDEHEVDEEINSLKALC